MVIFGFGRVSADWTRLGGLPDCLAASRSFHAGSLGGGSVWPGPDELDDSVPAVELELGRSCLVAGGV